MNLEISYSIWRLEFQSNNKILVKKDCINTYNSYEKTIQSFHELTDNLIDRTRKLTYHEIHDTFVDMTSSDYISGDKLSNKFTNVGIIFTIPGKPTESIWYIITIDDNESDLARDLKEPTYYPTHFIDTLLNYRRFVSNSQNEAKSYETIKRIDIALHTIGNNLLKSIESNYKG